MENTVETTIQTDNLFKVLARSIEHYHRVKNNVQFTQAFENTCGKLERIEQILPSGSGIDAGCRIDIDNSNEKRIVITFGYHFMNDAGYYDGWEDYKLILTPSLTNDFDIRITGKNRREIKDYLYELFDYELRQQIARY